MIGHSMSTRKTVIFACFGIAIGLCIGTVFKNYRALEIVKRCSLKHLNEKGPFEIIGMSPMDTIYNSQKNLVFVGVMTAKTFLNGRARAVYDTWGKEVPGRIAFFSSEGSTSNELPVISLKNVDDRYPPQKKSFMMLYYMYEHFLDKFEWFIRADDDVYINTEKLEKFLRSIDSSKPQFIGQAGKGNSEEFGLLSLEFDENFCMGGPGVILSRETLRRVAPHIPTCLKNLYSTHEDVEVGRCVQKFAGIPCTWNYEMQYILRHNSSGPQAFTGSFKRKEVHNAISLHPVKQGTLMYRLHSYIQGLKADEIRQEFLSLHRDINQMGKYLQIPKENKYLVPGISLYPEIDKGQRHIDDHTVLGVNPELNKYQPTKREELLTWNFVSRSLYSADNVNPKHKLDSGTKEGLEDAITEIMENINNYSRQRGRVIEFRELLYGYTRLNPLHGQDLILDLLLIYKKYRGKKMTVPVRRHLYAQRAFTGIFVKEFEEDFYNITLQQGKNERAILSSVKNIISTGFEKISNSFTIPGFKGKICSSNGAQSKITFTLPIFARFETYKRFLTNFEEIALKMDKNCNLLVVIFSDGKNSSSYEHVAVLNNLKLHYSRNEINYIILDREFSRGIGLNEAIKSKYINPDDIVLFIDVDMKFNVETLDRIRMNTIKGEQVYLPIVFSQYDPKRMNSKTKYNEQNDMNGDDEISNEKGYFRQFGYGICSIYKSDILDPDIIGFDTDINGWGLEDVKFLEKIIKVGHRQNTNLINISNMPDNSHFKNQTNYKNNMNGRAVRKLRIFRAPDPSLIHVYHEINCDKNLESSQYNMCTGTKASTLGNWKQVEDIFFNNKENIEFIMNANSKMN